MPEEERASPEGKFVEQSHDLDALRKSVEDAASFTNGLWLSYLGVLVYLGVAVGAVTHKDLLLENPISLPFLSNVPLPLTAFFILAPVIFIGSHAYTLVSLVILAAKVGVFETELKRQLSDAPVAIEGWRRQLPSNFFVQFLSGPRDIREGGLGLILNVIALSSLVVGPILLLLLIQAQFLPFHDERITWWHRVSIFVDICLLWLLWPAVLARRSEVKAPRPWRHPLAACASLVTIGLAVAAATFPGERLDNLIGNWKWDSPDPSEASLGAAECRGQPVHQPKWTSAFRDRLFNGCYDSDKKRRDSLFSNMLVLPGFNAPDEAAKKPLNLQGRHLEGAIVYRSDLREVYLGDAVLQGANLYQAKLYGANLFQAKLQWASLDQAHLQGASLEDAELQRASFEGAELEGVRAVNANFTDASLKEAHLEAASLKEAILENVDFENANVEAAEMDAAEVEKLKSSDMPAPSGTPIQADLIEGRSASDQAKSQKALADQKALAGQLQKLVCSNSDSESSRYILQRLIRDNRIRETGDYARDLVGAILKEASCPAAAILSEDDKAALGAQVAATEPAP